MGRCCCCLYVFCVLPPAFCKTVFVFTILCVLMSIKRISKISMMLCICISVNDTLLEKCQYRDTLQNYNIRHCLILKRKCRLLKLHCPFLQMCFRRCCHCVSYRTVDYAIWQLYQQIYTICYGVKWTKQLHSFNRCDKVRFHTTINDTLNAEATACWWYMLNNRTKYHEPLGRSWAGQCPVARGWSQTYWRPGASTCCRGAFQTTPWTEDLRRRYIRLLQLTHSQPKPINHSTEQNARKFTVSSICTFNPN